MDSKSEKQFYKFFLRNKWFKDMLFSITQKQILEQKAFNFYRDFYYEAS